MPDKPNKDERTFPYRAPKGRWGESIPAQKIVVNKGGGTFEERTVFPEVGGQCFPHPRPKPRATDARKNRTPRTDPNLQQVRSREGRFGWALSSDEFGHEYGEAGSKALQDDEGNINVDMVIHAVSMQIVRRMEYNDSKKRH